MKKICILLLLTSFTQVHSQTRYPRSFLDLGIGFGPNYGILGGQLVAGYKGSGLLIAAGYFSGFPAYSAGLQVSDKWFYVNVSYGTVGINELHINNYTKISPIYGTVVMIGGRLNLHKKKLFFLQLGAGVQFSHVETPFEELDTSGYTLGLGIGFRVPSPKKEKPKVE